MLTVRIISSPEEKEILHSVDESSFRLFDVDKIAWRSYVIVEEAGNVVGITAFTEQSIRYDAPTMGIGFIEVHEDHKGRGIGKLMASALVRHAKETGRAISNSSYEPEGKLYLRHVLHRETQAQQVQFFDVE